MSYVGILTTGLTFGFFKNTLDSSLSAIEVQLCIQDAADQDIQIDFVDGFGILQHSVAVLRSGTLHSSTILTNPVLWASGTSWSLKVLAAGSSDAPGQNLSARIVLLPA